MNMEIENQLDNVTKNTPNRSQSGPNPEYIQDLFESISTDYDKANSMITMGMVGRWRKAFIEKSGAKKGDKILDCATGTGDLAFEFKKVVGDAGQVIGTDFCKGMLSMGPEKAKRLKLDVKFEFADATQLPYENNQFDIASIGYGIRNVENPMRALSEMARVTKPGGRVMILETGETHNPVLRPFIKFYFNRIVPVLGGWATGKRSAYEYLNKSSNQFPCREEFLHLMWETGRFFDLEYTSLMGGASFIYKGVVKPDK